ncbi:MAG: hypothetical protein QXU20_01370 [Candidatus Woesearchaeota archaeon]
MKENYDLNSIDEIVNNPELLRKKLLDFDRKLTEIQLSENKYVHKRNFFANYALTKNINNILFNLQDKFESELLNSLIYKGIKLEIYFLGLINLYFFDIENSQTYDYAKERISKIIPRISLLDDSEKKRKIENQLKLINNIEEVSNLNKEINEYVEKSEKENIYNTENLNKILNKISKESSFYSKLLPHISQIRSNENLEEIFKNCTKLKENTDTLFKIYKDLKSELVELTLYSNLKIEMDHLKAIKDERPDYFRERLSEMIEKLNSEIFFNSKEKEKIVNSLEHILDPDKFSKEREVERIFKTINVYYNIFKTAVNLPNWTLKNCFNSVKEAVDFLYAEIKVEEFLKDKSKKTEIKEKEIDKKKLDFAYKGTKLIIEIIDEIIRREELGETSNFQPNINATRTIYEGILNILENLKN